jgi:hypothetical protein
MIFLNKNATPLEWLGFMSIGAPYTFLKAAVREGKNGNIGALKGILGGVLDLLKPS